MHPSMGKGPQVVEEELQLVHLGGGEDALEGDCLGAAALRSIRGKVERVFPVALKEGHSSREKKLPLKVTQVGVSFLKDLRLTGQVNADC